MIEWPQIVTNLYLDQMVKRGEKNRLPERVQDGLIQQFVADVAAHTAADLVDVDRLIAIFFYNHSELISLKFAETEPWLSG